MGHRYANPETDRDRIRHHLARLVVGSESADLTALSEVISKAQNPPPEGEADSSMGAEEWTDARDALEPLEAGWRLALKVLAP